MPTIFSHAAVPLALGMGLGPRIIPRRLLACGVFASILPDLDVLAFRLGIPYAHALGHRGFSHSLFAAVLVGLLAAAACRWLKTSRLSAFVFTAASMASHGLLDMLTDGGKGVALLWPWSSERLFAPWRVIEVSPIGLSRFLSHRGAQVVMSELLWIWIPCLVVCYALYSARSPRR